MVTPGLMGTGLKVAVGNGVSCDRIVARLVSVKASGVAVGCPPQPIRGKAGNTNTLINGNKYLLFMIFPFAFGWLSGVTLIIPGLVVQLSVRQGRPIIDLVGLIFPVLFAAPRFDLHHVNIGTVKFFFRYGFGLLPGF